MRVRRGIGLAALAAAVALGAGCGGRVTTTVTGEVTYDGRPVASGRVNFLPADGKGAAAGGTIEAGKYVVEGVTPGPNVVQVESFRVVTFPHDTSERAAEAARAKGRPARRPAPTALIPANARGNNARVDVEPGQQTLNLHLQKPPAPGRS